MKKDKKAKRGFALLAALVAVLLTAAVTMAYLTYSANAAHATMRMIDYEKAKMAAESGLEYGVMQLKNALLAYQFQLDQTSLQDLLDLIPTPPPTGDYTYCTPDGDKAFRIRVDSDVQTDYITQGCQCPGHLGDFQYFTISCGAMNTNTGVSAVLKESLQAVSVYLIRFGVFYEEDLEILPGPEMIFTGPVHCNSDMYLDGDSGPVRFHDRVTSHGGILHRRKDQHVTRGDVYIDNESGSDVSMEQYGEIIDSDHEDWMLKAILLWDARVLSDAHGIGSLDPPINPLDNDHDIIERPLPLDDPAYSAVTEAEKFANKAYLTIYVDAAGHLWASNSFGQCLTNRMTNAVLQTSGSFGGKPLYAKNADGTYIMRTNGVYDVTQTNFWDMREGCRMAPLDIYVDQLAAMFPELHSGTEVSVTMGRGIVYVTRDDPDGAGGLMPCVRLRNGRDLPDSGLSIASDLPIYVEGHYNVVDPHSVSLVAGDAVTFLSSNWQDARSSSWLGNRPAVDTTYHTVIMTGNSETIPNEQYNGGLENVLRFLEHWQSGGQKTVTYLGSIIDLWYAEEATGPWSYGNYYTAPRREWGYDEIYRTDAPPGMPRVFGLEELTWQKSTWEDESW